MTECNHTKTVGDYCHYSFCMTDGNVECVRCGKKWVPEEAAAGGYLIPGELNNPEGWAKIWTAIQGAQKDKQPPFTRREVGGVHKREWRCRICGTRGWMPSGVCLLGHAAELIEPEAGKSCCPCRNPDAPDVESCSCDCHKPAERCEHKFRTEEHGGIPIFSTDECSKCGAKRTIRYEWAGLFPKTTGEGKTHEEAILSLQRAVLTLQEFAAKSYTKAEVDERFEALLDVIANVPFAYLPDVDNGEERARAECRRYIDSIDDLRSRFLPER